MVNSLRLSSRQRITEKGAVQADLVQTAKLNDVDPQGLAPFTPQA